MKATETLHDRGQSLWLDNITRDLLETGTLKRYIDELSVTGLTSNPTIFDHAIKNSSAYDAAIRKKVKEGKSGEQLFFELALEDLTRAADLFRSIWDRTAGVDGWVSSVFISRWDAAVKDRVPEALRNQLGIAIAKQTYKAYRSLLGSQRWQRVFNTGARPQRLLWASTGTKDPSASDVLYIRALAAPFTVNTMPEGTLKALADHGALGEMLPADGGDSEEVLVRFARAGIDVDALASQLQDEGAKSFVNSWRELMDVIAGKSAALAKAS